jgi:hypothetical protein
MRRRMMQPEDIRAIDRRIIANLAQDIEQRTDSASDEKFSRYAKSPDYRLYGKDNFIKDAPNK